MHNLVIFEMAAAKSSNLELIIKKDLKKHQFCQKQKQKKLHCRHFPIRFANFVKTRVSKNAHSHIFYATSIRQTWRKMLILSSMLIATGRTCSCCLCKKKIVIFKKNLQLRYASSY